MKTFSGKSKLSLGRGRRPAEEQVVPTAEEESSESDEYIPEKRPSLNTPSPQVLDVESDLREAKAAPLTTFRYKEKDAHAKTQERVRMALLVGILLILLLIAFFQRGKLHTNFTLGASSEMAPTPLLSSLTPAPIRPSRPYCLLDDDEKYWEKTKLYQAQHPLDCSQAKFFVVVPGSQGFGASILSMTSVLRTWHEKGWVVVLAPRFRHGFWYFPDASECPNKEGDAWTCYFRPLTNCTLEDVYLRAGGVSGLDEAPQYGSAKANATVIVFSGYKQLKPYTENSISNSDGDSMNRDVLPSKINSKNAFYLRYLLRFNNDTSESLVSYFEQIEEVDSKLSVSLPIRASEKCGHPVYGEKPDKFESGCLALNTYVDLITHLQSQLHRPIEKVLVTSEDERYIKAAQTRQELWTTVVPVFNQLDTHPGTSRLADVPNTSHWTQFVSMFTTLEFLLQSDVFILNCASHFHLLLGLLRISDCPGSVTKALPQMHCLDSQNTPNQFHICDPAKDPQCEELTKRVMNELST